MFFLNVIDCTECKNDMKIDVFDKINKKITYKCECGATCVCDFDLVGIEKADDIFGLNETGLLTYKCSKCNYFVRDYLSSSYGRNKRIINKAHTTLCKKCINAEQTID